MGKMKLFTLAIVQARMASTRLPGKVLLDISGKPMLAHVVSRVSRAKAVDRVLVATTTSSDDDAIVRMCLEWGFAYFRGSMQDVLDRYYQAAAQFGADIVVRLTADCPIIDPSIIDETVYALFGGKDNWRESADMNLSDPQRYMPDSPSYDFTANRLPPPWHRTYPIGLDVEACTFQALERAWKEADQPHQREHVMPYLYEVEGRFRVKVIDHDPDYGNLRWTVDTKEDLQVVRQIFARFPGRDDFTWLEVLELFQKEPQLALLNQQVRHKDYREVQ